jgi:toxin ParE1/3/4
MKRYVLTQPARDDLDDIWFFIARQGGLGPAERLILRLQETIVGLAAHPEIGRRCDDIDEGGRCFPVAHYIIYYRVDSRRILITHVFHGRRDQRSAWRQAPKGRD